MVTLKFWISGPQDVRLDKIYYSRLNFVENLSPLVIFVYNFHTNAFTIELTLYVDFSLEYAFVFWASHTFILKFGIIDC